MNEKKKEKKYAFYKIKCHTSLQSSYDDGDVETLSLTPSVALRGYPKKYTSLLKSQMYINSLRCTQFAKPVWIQGDFYDVQSWK